MAVGLVTIGFNSIMLQEINPTTGADVGTPIQLGQTLEDSFNITNDEGTSVDILVEEVATPVFSRPGNVTTSITWQSPNVDPVALAAVTGGTWDPETGYDAPAKPLSKEYKVIIDSEQGYVLTYNRVKLTAKFDGAFGKNNALMITVNGTILNPVDGTTGPYNLTPKVPQA